MRARMGGGGVTSLVPRPTRCGARSQRIEFSFIAKKSLNLSDFYEFEFNLIVYRRDSSRDATRPIPCSPASTATTPLTAIATTDTHTATHARAESHNSVCSPTAQLARRWPLVSRRPVPILESRFTHHNSYG